MNQTAQAAWRENNAGRYFMGPERETCDQTSLHQTSSRQAR